MLAARPAAPAAFIRTATTKTTSPACRHGRASRAFLRRSCTPGTFYGPRDPAGLLGGVERYLQAAAAARDGRPRLRVRLVGNMGARFAAAVAAFGQQHPGVVETVP